MDLSAISSVVQTIGGQLIQEVTSLLGVKDQVEDLRSELMWMQSFLKEADARKIDNEVVRTCVAEIRELAYDAEDVIESFALKLASRRTSFIKRSACILKEGKLLRQTKSEIERITARITNLTRRLQTYDVKRLGDGEGSSSSTERVEKRRPYPHIIEDNIVGLDDDIKKLVPVLVDEESDCRVISICGMGGLGKTTLAKNIYHHSQVINHFNRLAWVYVSQQFNKRRVWEDILSKLTSINERGSKQSEEEIAETLFKFLKDEKCLVILDDIWSMEAWDSLKPAFPVRDMMRSKILLTSRNKEVVSHADRRGYLYEPQCLNDEQSWELFQKIAFPPADSTAHRVDERMEEMGRNMVKHCAGLPLAIIVLGGILISKDSPDEWQMVFDNVKSYLKRGKSQSTEDVLALSYDDLPPYLRPCFLYLSHFPEDYEIKAQRLIQLWVAEGFVSSKQEENGGEIMEHEAEGYLNELAERCMIQVRERKGPTLKIKTFQMHDLMRDFCLAKAKQENFFFIMDEPVKYLRGRNVLSSAVYNVRRVVGHHLLEIPRIKSPHLRSLFIFTRSLPESYMSTFEPLSTLINCIKNQEDCPPIFIFGLLALCILIPELMGICISMVNNFKFLRVLHYEEEEDGTVPKLPSDIGKFVHLRHLSLRDVLFCCSKLPSSLGNLRCLQTLDLSVKREICSGSVQVPNVIWRMQELRHLYLPKICTRKPKLKLGTMRKLQRLVNFSTRNCHVEDLLNMTSLR
ncbi:hypothetical protein PTKIN_Ptkin11bG0138100 [Pterospermum kingtungense]